MQVILHAGVHCTDDDRILKCLLRNANAWHDEGVAIPGPSRYRQLLSEVVNNLVDSEPTPEAREVLLDGILDRDPEHVERLILSHHNFFAVPKLCLQGGFLYKKAENRLRTLTQIFRHDQVELFLGLRDPATFLPAVLAATPHEDFASLLNGADPMHLRWSDLLYRIRTEVPSVPITVWANEDTPLIWGEVLREMAGIEITRKIIGAFDMFQAIISPEGMKRYRAFLKENPKINEMQKRRVMSAFLEKYAMDEAIEEEFDLPGWDAAYVDMLTELYEEDLYNVERIPGVELITP